jgi:hypothetical protein
MKRCLIRIEGRYIFYNDISAWGKILSGGPFIFLCSCFFRRLFIEISSRDSKKSEEKISWKCRRVENKNQGSQPILGTY